MRTVLTEEIKKETCNSAVFGAYNASVENSEPKVNIDDLIKKRDWDGLVMQALKNGDKTDFSQFNLSQETNLRGYLGAQRAAESWRKDRQAGRDEIQMNFKYFTEMREQKLQEIKRQFKLKDFKTLLK